MMGNGLRHGELIGEYLEALMRLGEKKGELCTRKAMIEINLYW